MPNNYDTTIETAKKIFLLNKNDIVLEKFDLKHDEEYLYIKFLSRDYSISLSDAQICQIDNKRNASFNEYLSIFDILCFSKDKPVLKNKWARVNSLPGLTNGVRNENAMYAPYAKYFENKTEELTVALKKLNGIATDKGDVGFILPVFDFFPIYFRFWEKDEDFESQVNFLWDENSLFFVHYETLWYMARALCDRLKEEIELQA